MTLPRDEVVTGLRAEMDRFEALVRSLDDGQWAARSRCEQWTVGDVAAHVVGQFVDAISGRFDGLGTPPVTQREVEEREGRSPAEIADELRQARTIGDQILAAFDDEAWATPDPSGLTPSLGDAVTALWYDTYVHGDDMRAALDLPPDRGPGLRASVTTLATTLTGEGWGPAELALDGLEEIPVSGGGGRRVTGDPYQFVLVATGRADPSSLGLDERVNVYRPR
jgi:uncharacterized protein (TIGR03083 family)